MTVLLLMLVSASDARAESAFDAGRVGEFLTARERVVRTNFEARLRRGSSIEADLRTLAARFPADTAKLDELKRELAGAPPVAPRAVDVEGAGYRITTAHGRTFRLGVANGRAVVNDRPLHDTNLGRYLGSIERALAKTFATAWWFGLATPPEAVAAGRSRALVVRVAAAAIEIVAASPHVPATSMRARARTATAWFTSSAVICRKEIDARVPYDGSVTQENVEGLASQSAFMRDGTSPVDCPAFVKRALAAVTDGKNDLTPGDAQALCAGAAAFSTCVKEYRRRDAGGSRIEPASLTPSGR